MKQNQIYVFAVASALIFSGCSHIANQVPAAPLHQELAAQFEGDIIAVMATLAAPHLLVGKLDTKLGGIEALAAHPEIATNPLFNRAKRIELLGSAFDKAENWLMHGIDPNAGFGVILHRDLFAVLIIKVTDLGKLLALAERAGAGVGITQGNTNGVTRFTLGEESGLMIDLGGRSALVMGKKGLAYGPAKLKRELTKPAKSLAERQAWKMLAPTGAADFTLVGDTEVALHSIKSAGNKEQALKLLRGIGLSMDASSSSVSLWVGETLKRALSLITGAKRSLPAIANPLLAPDQLAFRLRLGLPTLVEGLNILLPSEAGTIKVGIGRADQMLSQMGMSVKMLTEALSGDIIVGLPVSALNEKNPEASNFTQVIAVLAANDQKALETVVQRLARLATAMGGKELTIGGRPAMVLPAGPMPIYLVLAHGGLVLGLSPEVIEARLKTAAKVAAPVVAAPNTIVGLYVDSKRSVEEKVAKAQAELKAADASDKAELEAKLAAAKFGEAFAQIDNSLADRGELLVGSGSGMMVIATVGVLAMVAIPNFIKFQCRAKQSEAKANLQAAWAAHQSYFLEYDKFTSIEQSGFGIEPGNRYTYCFSATDCVSCDTAQASCKATLERAKAACKSAFYNNESRDFKLCAAGNLDNNNQDLDVWTIDFNKALININNDCQ